MGLALRDDAHHTYGEYRTWTDEVRVELVDGIAYLMAPAPLIRHARIAGELFAQVREALRGKPCEAFIAPVDVRLPKRGQTDDTTDTVVQPDVFVVCDPTKIDKQGVRGAPDWVVEVLSPSTAGHDQITKRSAYEAAGVQEYWLVHPTDRVLTVYRLEAGRFASPAISVVAGETPIAVLPGVVVQWQPILDRIGPDTD